MVGPAGAGKTMLASRLPGLLPALSPEEALEVAKVHSAAGLEVGVSGLSLRPPFRTPPQRLSCLPRRWRSCPAPPGRDKLRPCGS